MRNNKLMKRLLPVLLFVVFLFAFFPGCSSPPKRKDEIFIDRNAAAKQLNLANHTASRGRYEDALIIMEDAWRLVLGTDDPTLRIKGAISRGNILFSLGRHDEAFRIFESAAAEGDASSLPVLAAQARIYAIRARLVLLSGESGSRNDTDETAEELRGQLISEMYRVRTDPLSSAAGYVTLGMAEKLLRRWGEAEIAVRRALATHERDRFLEDAAYDWFLVASIRSMAESYDAAIDALKMAILFDRRAENGFGLASSWQAMGDVYKKAGQTEEARGAYLRAIDIYRAIGLDDRAKELAAKL